MINVKDFGAVGDGLADDQAAIQAALNAAGALGGGHVYLPHGVYRVNQIAIPSYVRVTGDGAGVSVLKKRDTTQPLIVGSEPLAGNAHIAIEQLTIDGNRSAIQGSISGDGNAMGVRMDRWSSSTLRDLHVVDCGTDSVYLGASANDRTHVNEDILIDRVQVSNSRRNGLSIITACRVVVRDSVFRGTTGIAPEAGVDIEPDSRFCRLEDLVFTNVITRNNAGDGFAIFLSNVSVETVRIQATHCSSLQNTGRGFRIARVDDDATGGLITVTDCSAVENGGTGFLVDLKSIHGPRVNIVRPYVKDNADGVIADSGDTARAQIKCYASGMAGTTQAPGGVDLIDPTGENGALRTNKPLLEMSGNVNWNQVTIRSPQYLNKAGSDFWSLGTNFGQVRMEGTREDHFRRVTKTSGSVFQVAVSDSYTRFDNAGANGATPWRLFPAPSPSQCFVRLTWRVVAPQTISVTPSTGDSFVGMPADAPLSSSAIGAQLILENSAAGRWAIVQNNAFV